MEFYENKQEPEKAVLIAVDTGEYNCETSLDELEELAATAGAQVTGRMWQKRDKPDSATFLGSGRLEELAEFCESNEIDLVIADSELSPAQLRNIEKETDTRVVDRTTLILDIFADRARSNEGKLQVELAQLKYSLPRLTGKGIQLSRLGGGIGTRGPGETKLETDRRHIRRRVKSLEEELESLEKRRGLARARREKDGVETVVIVGYTNAGKSTLMNALTEAGVLAQDKLFATLDPTSRALTLPDGRKVMLIDTVGFVRRLPHHLVEAFKSTLEEAAQADIILNVCDASSSEARLHLEVTKDLLTELGCGDPPIISVLNKCDIDDTVGLYGESKEYVRISAKTGEGIPKLLTAIEDNLPVRVKKVKLLLPFDKGGLASDIRKNCTLISEEYTAEGIEVVAIVDEQYWHKVRDFAVED